MLRAVLTEPGLLQVTQKRLRWLGHLGWFCKFLAETKRKGNWEGDL